MARGIETKGAADEVTVALREVVHMMLTHTLVEHKSLPDLSDDNLMASTVEIISYQTGLSPDIVASREVEIRNLIQNATKLAVYLTPQS